MEQSMFILLLGVVLGCVVASGIWAVLWTLIKGDKRQQKDRIDIMQYIAELCAETDGILAGRAGSGAVFSEFRSSVSSLLEKIQRNLTASMPLLDVYYVKYIEFLIARYEQALTQEKPPAIIGKTAALSTIVEKDAAEPIEEPGLVTAADFDVTQQYDLEKEKPVPEFLDKKTAVIKKTGKAPATKEFKIMKEPQAPIAAARSKKPDVDFSDEIAFEFKRMSPDESKNALEGTVQIKPEAEKMPTEDTGVVDIEEMIKTQKIDVKEESAKTATQQLQEEHFISGEDVIDKLDSFFGFDNK
jgi:hypothetical protein